MGTWGWGVSRGAPCQPRREGGLSRERPQAAAPQLSQASLPEASCATREGGGQGLLARAKRSTGYSSGDFSANRKAALKGRCCSLPQLQI